MKDDILTILTTPLVHFLKVGRMYLLSLEVERLKLEKCMGEVVRVGTPMRRNSEPMSDCSLALFVDKRRK